MRALGLTRIAALLVVLPFCPTAPALGSGDAWAIVDGTVVAHAGKAAATPSGPVGDGRTELARLRLLERRDRRHAADVLHRPAAVERVLLSAGVVFPSVHP